MIDNDTNKVKSILGSIFDSVGIASKGNFINAPDEYHPKNLLADFESVIVYAQGDKYGNASDMGSFRDIWGCIAAQNDAVKYLESAGYISVIVQGDSKNVSLIHMGIEAGLGEMSPVNSLVVRGLGLTASLAAIITQAPLIPDEKVTDICIKCMDCMKVCPATKVEYQRDPKKCGCGKCRNICPA